MKLLIDLELVQKASSPKAYGVTQYEEDEDLIWLPKSQVERGEKLNTRGNYDHYEYTMPEWLAKEKGLI